MKERTGLTVSELSRKAEKREKRNSRVHLTINDYYG